MSSSIAPGPKAPIINGYQSAPVAVNITPEQLNVLAQEIVQKIYQLFVRSLAFKCENETDLAVPNIEKKSGTIFYTYSSKMKFLDPISIKNGKAVNLDEMISKLGSRQPLYLALQMHVSNIFDNLERQGYSMDIKEARKATLRAIKHFEGIQNASQSKLIKRACLVAAQTVKI